MSNQSGTQWADRADRPQPNRTDRAPRPNSLDAVADEIAKRILDSDIQDPDLLALARQIESLPAQSRPRVERQRPPAFKIDSSVRMELEFTLALELGRLILESGTKNTALIALAKQIESESGD